VNGPRLARPREGEQFKLTIRYGLLEFLKWNAHIRDVPTNQMCVDVLTCWVRRGTPVGDPRFALQFVGYQMPELRPEPYPGYFSTLRFLPESECRFDPNEPPPETNGRFPDEL
jgi:hypothetical protein